MLREVLRLEGGVNFIEFLLEFAFDVQTDEVKFLEEFNAHTAFERVNKGGSNDPAADA